MDTCLNIYHYHFGFRLALSSTIADTLTVCDLTAIFFVSSLSQIDFSVRCDGTLHTSGSLHARTTIIAFQI